MAEFALSTTVGGAEYSVVGATLEIVGPASAPSTKTITDISASVVSVELKAGAYTVELKGNPQLAPTSAPGEVIDAELVSPNPQSFIIGDYKRLSVAFKFKLKSGKVDVGVAYSTAGGFVKGTATVTSVTRSTNSRYPASHEFDPLSSQTISFSATWEQAVPNVRDGQSGGKDRYFDLGRDIVAQFGGDGAVLSGIFDGTRTYGSILFNANNGVVTLGPVDVAAVFGGGLGSSAAGDVDYDCHLLPQPPTLDVTAYGAAVDAAGYPDGKAVVGVPVRLECVRILFYDEFGLLLYNDTDKLVAEGTADIVPSLQY